jgi:heat shock protein HslJ
LEVSLKLTPILSFLASVSVAALSSGCGSETVTNPSMVEGVTWRLQRLERNGQGAVTVSAPDRYTLSFTSEKRLAVRSDCNQCGGGFDLVDGRLSVGPVACTKAFCGEQSLDADYTALLAEAQSLEKDGDELVLRSSRGTLRFRP